MLNQCDTKSYQWKLLRYSSSRDLSENSKKSLVKAQIFLFYLYFLLNLVYHDECSSWFRDTHGLLQANSLNQGKKEKKTIKETHKKLRRSNLYEKQLIVMAGWKFLQVCTPMERWVENYGSTDGETRNNRWKLEEKVWYSRWFRHIWRKCAIWHCIMKFMSQKFFFKVKK